MISERPKPASTTLSVSNCISTDRSTSSGALIPKSPKRRQRISLGNPTLYTSPIMIKGNENSPVDVPAGYREAQSKEEASVKTKLIYPTLL